MEEVSIDIPLSDIRHRSSIPIIPGLEVALSRPERNRVAELWRRLLRDEPALSNTVSFGPLVSTGLSDAPALLIGDQREIALKAEVAEQNLEYRIAMLAGDADSMAVERARPDFNRYLVELLGIGGFETLEIGLPHGPPWAIPARLRLRPDLLARLVARARTAGRFQIIPHLGTGWVWVLAAELASRSGAPVCIAAPPPRLSRRVNDKLWFAARVRELLGSQALPPTFFAFGPAAVSAHLARLSHLAERVIVKVPDSAGGEGNIALASDELRRLRLVDIRGRILGLLRARGWTGRFPLLVGVWDSGVTTSPSVQMWIPEREAGDPIIEGLFEQRLTGDEGDFVGAMPARLPDEIVARLASEALQIAVLFQYLGYFGRCSLDALVLDKDGRGATLHWIECNGRWGGVSIPMTLANRLLPDGSAAGITILQEMSVPLATSGIKPCLSRLGPLLYRRGAREGVVPLSAAVLERGRGVHLASFAARQSRADELASDAVARLRGPAGSAPP